jgi:hypothetical protein
MAGAKNSTETAQGAGSQAQVAVHPVTASDAVVGRMVARLSLEYFMRTVELITEPTGGDLIAGVVLHVIMLGNIGHVDRDPKTFGQYTSVEAVPPDEVRRPISDLAVAGSLGMPYENTRRCVNKLVKAGLCVRAKGGIVVPTSTMDNGQDDAAILANMANVRRFCRALKIAGVAID